ncbi:MAG: MFS transporter [Caulobacteraceae bacterium]|nr:MFS transporter [Caulobacteraceae bacterium]
MRLFALAGASAAVVANGYYVQPLIGRVAAQFRLGAAMSGIIPAANQVALALGIFFLLPLGDRVGPRRLTLMFVVPQLLAVAGMAMAKSFALFVACSTVLGFFTITPYLVPAYVSKHVPVARLGYATAVISAGVTGGILFARAGGGLIGRYFGWRAVYEAGAGLMLIVCFLMPFVMQERRDPALARPRLSYLLLLRTLPSIVREHPGVLLSAAIQALNFGIFLSVWLGISLHLTSPQMGYGVDTVGYLGGFSLLNLATTPRLGALADRIGARRGRLIAAFVQWIGVAALGFAGGSLWLLTVPVLIMTLAGPVIDITGRMTLFEKDHEIRTRLMTIYITVMFMAGGAASWAGTAAYGRAGWPGIVALELALSTLLTVLAYASLRRWRRPDAP